MRRIELELAGQPYHLRVSLAAATDLARADLDPLRITMQTSSVGYLPLSFHQVCDVIYLGIKADGGNLDRLAIQEAVLKRGVMNYIEVVASYINALVSGEPEKPPDAQGETPKKT